MDYAIKGLSAGPYRYLYGKTDEELKTFGV